MQKYLDLIKRLLEDEVSFYKNNVKNTDLMKMSYDFIRLAESSGKIKAYKELLDRLDKNASQGKPKIL